MTRIFYNNAHENCKQHICKQRTDVDIYTLYAKVKNTFRS